MKKKSFFNKTWHLLKETLREFISDNALQLSAALSCYTLFSLTPLLIVIVYICGMFFGEQAVRGEIFDHINGIVGSRAAFEIQETIKAVKLSSHGTLATIIGVIVSIIAASGVFAEIQTSINYMWGVKTKHPHGFRKFIINRLMSFILIFSTGILFLGGLIINSLMDVLNKRLIIYLPDLDVNLYYTINLLILFILLILLFTVVYKILPDGKIALVDCLIGATFTAALFMIGKLAVGSYFGSSTFTSIYGAAGTLILLLAWVYYSSIILYFGAEFTKVYARIHGDKITPNAYSVRISKV